MTGPLRTLVTSLATIALTGLAALAAGCTSQDAAESPTASGRAPAAVSPCPAATASVGRWPASVPAGLPRPPGLRVVDVSRQGKVSIVRFTTAQSLTDAARFLVARLPKAGYTLRRGDSEGDEVDQPFSGRGHRASIKLRGASRCVTQGTLVTQAS